MQHSRVQGMFEYGGVLLVPVKVNGQRLQFMVDTGAAFCAISEDARNLLDLQPELGKSIPIAPATGEIIRSPVVVLNRFSVGRFESRNQAAVVLSFPRQLKIDGLLGMNFLRGFRFTF